jgi:thiamine-phosphate pyrophosphorylase
LRYLITQGTSIELIRRAVADGIDFVQVREKALAAGALLAYTRSVVATGARVLVNDRLDVALAAGAAGVHLRGHAPAPRRLRPLTPAGFLIAVSCHTVEEVARAEAEGADFTVLSPVFAKPDYAPPLGLAALAAARARVRIPVFALGGITRGNAGACGDFAAIGLFQSLYGP